MLFREKNEFLENQLMLRCTTHSNHYMYGILNFWTAYLRFTKQMIDAKNGFQIGFMYQAY